ncbi:MAG: SMC-Scp complex subunit ScpB [Arenicella sp.]|jgi:segregation and condensation protein B|nr:SMC-Scp complex subunit ScpB [Arenicella sp.]
MSDKPQVKDQPDDSNEISELKNIIEAALFAASEPLTVRKLIRLFPDDAQPTKDEIKEALDRIESEYSDRGVELKKLGKGWRFRSKEKYATWLRRLTINNPPRFSRALLETLSIIAYRQPVTRGDIEEIRGVAVSTDIIRAIEDRGWIAEIGHRDVPGRPALFGTTSEFLEYFGLESLRELPELMQPRELIEVAKEMNLTLPQMEYKGEQEPISDDVAGAEGAVEGAGEGDLETAMGTATNQYESEHEGSNLQSVELDQHQEQEEEREVADVIPIRPSSSDQS